VYKQRNTRNFEEDGFLVTCTPKVYAQAQAAIYGVPPGMEVGMLIACDIDPKTGVIEVTDIFIPTQTVGAGDVDFDAEQVAECDMDAFMAGKVINGWWHSHGHAGVFWSGTDEETISRMRQSLACGYVVSIVSNQKGDILCRVDYKSTSAFGDKYIKCDDIDFELKHPRYVSDTDAIRNSLKERVTMYERQAVNVVSKGVDKSNKSKSSDPRTEADDDFDDLPSIEEMRNDLKGVLSYNPCYISDDYAVELWLKYFGDTLEDDVSVSELLPIDLLRMREELEARGISTKKMDTAEVFDTYDTVVNVGK
jgi:proteasome lid subunit RPN8/RPN11